MNIFWQVRLGSLALMLIGVAGMWYSFEADAPAWSVACLLPIFAGFFGTLWAEAHKRDEEKLETSNQTDHTIRLGGPGGTSC